EVRNAYWSSSLTSSMSETKAGSRCPMVGRAMACSTRAGTSEGPGPKRVRAGGSKGFIVVCIRGLWSERTGSRGSRTYTWRPRAPGPARGARPLRGIAGGGGRREDGRSSAFRQILGSSGDVAEAMHAADGRVRGPADSGIGGRRPVAPGAHEDPHSIADAATRGALHPGAR